MSTITITFAVRESKSRTSGEAPIQVLLIQNGARASFSTGKAVQPSEWDRDRQRVKVGMSRVWSVFFGTLW